MEILDLNSRAVSDSSIVRREFHCYSPIVNSLEVNDEIRIAQNFADNFTLPSSSYLQMELALDDSSTDDEITMVNNFPSFLFDEIRLELFGITIAEARNVGLLSTVKSLCTLTASENLIGDAFGWKLGGFKWQKGKNLDICVPLRHFLNIFNDFQKIMVNAKLELILNRSKSDTNCYIDPYKEKAAALAGAAASENVANAASTAATSTVTPRKVKINLKKLTWNIEFIYLNDIEKIKILKSIDRSVFFPIQFRHWEFFSSPLISKTTQQSLTLKTALSLEKPRFVIVFFSHARKDELSKDYTIFDNARIRNVRLFLNDNFYPYNKSDFNFDSDDKKKTALFYHNYIEFRKAHLQNPEITHFLDRQIFVENYLLSILNCEEK